MVRLTVFYGPWLAQRVCILLPARCLDQTVYPRKAMDSKAKLDDPKVRKAMQQHNATNEGYIDRRVYCRVINPDGLFC